MEVVNGPSNKESIEREIARLKREKADFQKKIDAQKKEKDDLEKSLEEYIKFEGNVSSVGTQIGLIHGKLSGVKNILSKNSGKAISDNVSSLSLSLGKLGEARGLVPEISDAIREKREELKKKIENCDRYH